MKLSFRLLVTALAPALSLLPTSGGRAASIVRLSAGCDVAPSLCVGPPPNFGFVSVAAGNYHTMALKLDGSITTWGDCDVDQCNVPSPNTTFTAISAGDSHSLALRADGSVAAWGSNEYGQLDVPQPNSDFVAIAAGLLHNIALKADGSIVDWGYNLWGAPLVPQPNTDWIAIAAGGYYRIGVKSDGSIRKWGCNGPCPVPSPNSDFVAAATHFEHSLAVKKDGSIVAWGSNQYGQLDVPAPNTGFVAVAAGDHFSLGLKSDGSIAAWGQYGQNTVPLPNRGYLALTANKGVAYALKSELSDPLFSEAPQISSFVGQGITALAIDVDGDGDQDLMSSEYSADTLVWYENNGLAPPIWTRRTIDGSAFGPQSVAAADFDGDGDVDALSPNFNDDSFAWYENDGASPPSWTRRIVQFVTGPWAVHAADIDGDGDIDGIGGLRLDGPDHLGVEWFDNDGGTPPSFTVRRVSAGFVDAAAVHAADVDGDGDNDILAVDVFRDSVFCYENDGGSPPVWTERIVATTTDAPFSVFAADLDRDGDLDVLTASQDDDEIAWHENRGGSPPSWTPHKINTAPGALAVYARDLDGDGDLDVVSGAWQNEIAWYENDGGVPPSFTKRVLSNDCASQAVFAGRLDPDADFDLLVSCATTGQLRWYPNHANFAESDGDGVRDSLDCAPADASAFAAPGEIEGARYRTPSSVVWSTAAPRWGPGTVYDVLRGSIDGLPVGSEAGEICAGPATTGTTFSEDSLPSPGAGVYHLVRGRNACGEGTYGVSSSGVERTSAVCP